MNTPKPALLDQFAMAALTGLLASEAYSGSEGYIHYSPERAATTAYAIAQEMMHARERVAVEKAQEQVMAARRAKEQQDMDIEKQLDALQRKADTHYMPGWAR